MCSFVNQREAVFLPGSVEQRDHAVVEEIEIVFQRVISLADAFDDQRGEVMGQHACGTGQPHEGDGHFGQGCRVEVVVLQRQLLE